jgi:transcriptional regulator with XRE-family HTH domain
MSKRGRFGESCDVGDAMKERRRQLGGWTQTRLAQEAGVEVGVVQALEQGKRIKATRLNRERIGRALRWEDTWLEKLQDGVEPDEMDALSVIRQETPEGLAITTMIEAASVDTDTKREAWSAAMRAAAQILDNR